MRFSLSAVGAMSPDDAYNACTAAGGYTADAAARCLSQYITGPAPASGSAPAPISYTPPAVAPPVSPASPSATSATAQPASSQGSHNYLPLIGAAVVAYLLFKGGA